MFVYSDDPVSRGKTPVQKNNRWFQRRPVSRHEGGLSCSAGADGGQVISKECQSCFCKVTHVTPTGGRKDFKMSDHLRLNRFVWLSTIEEALLRLVPFKIKVCSKIVTNVEIGDVWLILSLRWKPEWASTTKPAYEHKKANFKFNQTGVDFF